MAKRLPMRKIREILRHSWVLRRSLRQVARSLGVSVGVVGTTKRRALLAGLGWDGVEALSDDQLETLLYKRSAPPKIRPQPDCQWIHRERRRKGVTLSLLHLEYLEANPGGYQYTQFCDIYRKWTKKHRLSMRQVHRAGEKLFVDYSGKRPSIIDPETGERRPVELFTAVLGASSYIYAEATLSQKGPDWIESHMRAFDYLGGVPEAVVCDQLKSGVVKACRYEPKIQRTYEEMSTHYGTTVLPARPRSPRDKAKAEVSVQIVQRWILARLRNRRFFSLVELNEAIRELLVDVNQRSMKHYGASRRELFERLDKPALRPLPEKRFVYGSWSTERVSPDYHVTVDHHAYSVPYQLADSEVDVRLSARTVEVFHNNGRVASHIRSWTKGGVSRKQEHMPASHRAHQDWAPTRLMAWSAEVGEQTEQLVKRILAERPHPEQGYRSCLGLRRLERQYGKERLDAACGRALVAGARSYRHVASILKNGLDRLPLEDLRPRTSIPRHHDNIRGADYYN